MGFGFADIARQRPLLSSFFLPGPLLFAPNIPSGALPPNPRDLPHGSSSGRSRPRGLTPPGTCRMLAAGSARVASLQSPVLCCGAATSVAVAAAPVFLLRSGYYSGFIRTNLSGFDRTTSGFDRMPTDFFATDFSCPDGLLPASSRWPLGVMIRRGRACVRLRDQFPGFFSLCRWFGPTVRAGRDLLKMKLFEPVLFRVSAG